MVLDLSTDASVSRDGMDVMVETIVKNAAQYGRGG